MAEKLRQPGRWPDHKQPLSSKDREATLATLKFLHRDKKMKAPALGRMLFDFGDDHYQRIERKEIEPPYLPTDLPNFDPDVKAINRAINGGTASDAVLLALHLWLRDRQSHLYRRHLHDAHVLSRETFVRSSRGVLGADDKLELAKINRLRGRYRLIRPFHLDPRSRAIAELFVVGTDDSPYECHLTATFEDEFGRTAHTRATGRIVPHAQRAMALLGNGPAGRSHLVLHFDSIPLDDETKLATAMRGILIASIGSHASSAYPVQCIRLDPNEPFDPHVLRPGEIDALPRAAREALDRGAVYWNKDDYPGWQTGG